MDKKKSGKGILIFFLAVISIFTLINLYEFLRGTEEVGRKKGLAQLDTMQDFAVTAWGGIQKAAGKKLAFGSTRYEDVTRLKNGTATMADFDSSIEAAKSGVASAVELSDRMGAKFLYVQVPGKELSVEEFPKGVEDYSVEKYDGMVAFLKEQRVDYISMRDVIQADMEANNEDWMSYFYKTDHHWQNKAAFLAYKEICNYMMNNSMEINTDYLSGQSYEKKLYEKVFLGTHGRMAGPLYTGLDDYELWLPDFDTLYTLDVPSQGIHKEGNFETCFVNYENLGKYSYDYYAYYAYLKEDFECFEIVNHNNPQGAKVVIVRDSEAVPVSVFLSTQCSELDILDLRYNNQFEYISYIEDKKPDLVLYIFGTGYLGNESATVLR